jgi:hypothetical protein
MSEVNFQFGLEYIAWTESKYHNAPAPSYQDWLEIQLQSERFSHNEIKQEYDRLSLEYDGLTETYEDTCTELKRLYELEETLARILCESPLSVDEMIKQEKDRIFKELVRDTIVFKAVYRGLKRLRNEG